MNQFFEDLGRRWAEVASKRGSAIEKPELDSGIALELLELARVAAHTQERRFAPLASFMAGVAAERLKVASGASAAELADYIREVRQQLEREPPI